MILVARFDIHEGPHLVISGDAVRFQLLAGAKPEPVSDSALRDVRIGGFFSVVRDTIAHSSAIIRTDGLRLMAFGGREVPLGIPGPALASPTASPYGGLEVRNDEATVVRFPGERTPAPKGIGSSVFHVYREKTRTWRPLAVPGSASMVRAFGPWLAFVVAEEQPTVPMPQGGGVAVDPGRRRASPGRQARAKRALVKGEDAQRLGWRTNSAETLFAEAFEWYPGTLILYNVDTGKQYRWDTKEGDSEVVLVEGSDVYYRVNETLYHATMGSASLENVAPVVTDPAVGTVHCAFIPR